VNTGSASCVFYKTLQQTPRHEELIIPRVVLFVLVFFLPIPFPFFGRKTFIYNLIKGKKYGANKTVNTDVDGINSLYAQIVNEMTVIECYFQKFQRFRRIFTRYDNFDSSFLAFVYIGAIAVLLK
jgi:hypothetical protein